MFPLHPPLYSIGMAVAAIKTSSVKRYFGYTGSAHRHGAVNSVIRPIQRSATESQNQFADWAGRGGTSCDVTLLPVSARHLLLTLAGPVGPFV